MLVTWWFHDDKKLCNMVKVTIVLQFDVLRVMQLETTKPWKQEDVLVTWSPIRLLTDIDIKILLRMIFWFAVKSCPNIQVWKIGNVHKCTFSVAQFFNCCLFLRSLGCNRRQEWREMAHSPSRRIAQSPKSKICTSFLTFSFANLYFLGEVLPLSFPQTFW